MAKVTFITFYDQYSAGLRIMSNILRKAGHSCTIIYFKLFYAYEIDTPHKNPIANEVFKEWQLKEYVNSDSVWTPHEIELLIDRLKLYDPDIIGISNRSPMDNPCLPLLNRIRQTFPQKIIIAGGYGPVLNSEHYLKEIDFVAFGDGEETILEIANAYDNGAPIEKIDNLIFIRDGVLVRNQVRVPVDNIDKYPIPDYDNPDICYISDNTLFDKDPITLVDPDTDTYPILIGRGCVHKCAYCSAGQWGKLYRDYGNHRIRPHRIRPTNHIMEELKIAKTREYKWISILESHLVGSKRYLMDFFHTYKEQIGLPFSAYLHPVQVVRHPEILDAACDAGLSKSPLGIQHGSEAFCREYFNRNNSNELILKVAKMYHARKFKMEYQFIAGIPFETEETLNESFEFVEKLPVDFATIVVSRLKVFPNSPLEKMIEKRKLPKACNPNEWYFQALLYNFRAIFKNNFFEKVRQMTSRFVKDHSGKLPRLLPLYYHLLMQELKKEHITVFGNWILLKKIYQAYLAQLKKQQIIVCGDEEHFNGIRDIFSDVTIKAFIEGRYFKNGNLVRKTLNNGIPVKSAEYLKDSKLPIFICSNAKKEVYQNIKKYDPAASIIP